MPSLRLCCEKRNEIHTWLLILTSICINDICTSSFCKLEDLVETLRLAEFSPIWCLWETVGKTQAKPGDDSRLVTRPFTATLLFTFIFHSFTRDYLVTYSMSEQLPNNSPHTLHARLQRCAVRWVRLLLAALNKKARLTDLNSTSCVNMWPNTLVAVDAAAAATECSSWSSASTASLRRKHGF